MQQIITKSNPDISQETWITEKVNDLQNLVGQKLCAHDVAAELFTALICLCEYIYSKGIELIHLQTCFVQSIIGGSLEGLEEVLQSFEALNSFAYGDIGEDLFVPYLNVIPTVRNRVRHGQCNRFIG